MIDICGDVKIFGHDPSPFYSVYGAVTMILIVEYTLALYSKTP